MSDFLLDSASARKIIKSLGLPIPVPQRLTRAIGPLVERPLADRKVVVGGAPGGHLTAMIASALAEAGADSFVIGDESLVHSFAGPGQAFGRPSASLEITDLPESFSAHALVFDATGIANPSDLHGLYAFFHALVGHSLQRCGRILVLSRPVASANTAAQAAALAALEGFVRSVAKEIGKRGSTAQLVSVCDGAESRAPAVLRFLLSDRAAFITGQPIEVSAVAAERGAFAWTHPLEGKTALVTGAARGIGKATAALLAAEGAHVVCLDRPQDDGPVSQVARDCRGSVLLADVSSPEAPGDIAAALDERGGVDVVVHNAGITRDKTLKRMSAEIWDQTLEINLAGVVRITDALLAGPLRDGGRIICLSSIAGIAGNMGQTNYAASKAGIIGMVRQLAPTLAERGITVNAIAPGFIETRLTAAIPVMIREVGRRLSALGQGGKPRDVGDAITFLATPASVGITGQVLRVCGGAFIGA